MGNSARSCLRTAQDIVGRQEAVAALSVTPEMGLRHVSRRRCRRPSPVCLLPKVVDSWSTCSAGRPATRAAPKTKDIPSEVLTGVNLYMLLSSFTHRDKMDLKALAAKVAEDGKRAIVHAKDLLKKRMS